MIRLLKAKAYRLTHSVFFYFFPGTLLILFLILVFLCKEEGVSQLEIMQERSAYAGNFFRDKTLIILFMLFITVHFIRVCQKNGYEKNIVPLVPKRSTLAFADVVFGYGIMLVYNVWSYLISMWMTKKLAVSLDGSPFSFRWLDSRYDNPLYLWETANYLLMFLFLIILVVLIGTLFRSGALSYIFVFLIGTNFIENTIQEALIKLISIVKKENAGGRREILGKIYTFFPCSLDLRQIDTSSPIRYYQGHFFILLAYVILAAVLLRFVANRKDV